VDLDVVFLGTAGSAPTAQRGPSALLVRRGGERLLVDCGEGTQRQLLRSNVGLVDLREVFLTHYHADHYLGLPGMMKTFALRGRDVPLTIYGPPGLDDLFGALRRVFGRLTYTYELETVRPGDVLERGDYDLDVFGVEHGVAAVGYALVEHARPGRFDVAAADALGVPNGPERGALQRGEAVSVGGRAVMPEEVLGPPRAGRKLVLTGDSAPSAGVLEVASGADLLVHEATFLSDEEGRARETMHSTALGAAALARDAGVQLLALTHISSRYGGGQVAHEARTVFPDTVVPKDFDTIELPFEERGKPRLHKGGALDQEPGATA
jgi:ribonuclease Z